jgi:uncharacterized protein YcbK (DUF882 family)
MSKKKFNPERRRLLQGMMAAAPSLIMSAPGLVNAKTSDRKSLSFEHAHTGEKLSLVYHENGQYLQDSLQEMNHFLRDFRTGEIYTMDTQLLDILHEVHSRAGARKDFVVYSGYRSPKTNAMLNAKSSGVAKRSLHMQGRAIDVRLHGVKTAELRDAALKAKRGGVGYYRKSGFVHLDTGRVRHW